MPAKHLRVLSVKVVKEAEAHLSRADRVMKQLIREHAPCTLAKLKLGPYETIVRSIVSQQLSVKAANTILGRIVEAAGTLEPEDLLRVSETKLRKAGLSGAKTRYVRELSKRVRDGALDFTKLRDATDEDTIAALTELPGVGPWTAEMFLIFGLRRCDVLSVRDGGLQRAVREHYGADADMEAVGEKWRPYRSVACWYLWRSLDNA